MEVNVSINYRVLSADYHVAIGDKYYTIVILTLAECMGRKLPCGVKHTETVLYEETPEFSYQSVQPGTIIPIDFSLFKGSCEYSDTYKVHHVY
ncbi:MAG: hypothetical protein J6C18_03295 [Bacteroidaceae bacterium]|nr:hypothetical protein [Bacteroidaceae bacterium]